MACLVRFCPGDGTQGILRSLGPVCAGNKHREDRVFGRLVLEWAPRQMPAMVFTKSRKLMRSWEAIPESSRMDLPLAHSVRDLERPS